MAEEEFNEAGIQVLASLFKAQEEATGGDRATLEEAGKRFWIFKEDWTDAFPALLSGGLIEGDDGGYRLTDTGRPLGARYHAERPDMYWYYYQKFYPAARASRAHSRLCERVFGMDLTQEGQADMPALHQLLQLLNIDADEHVLDLGCGAGVIAEYISGKTGARVTGLDYATEAIREARDRSRAAGGNTSFIQGDMNALDLPEASFDAVISIDTLYWVADLARTMRDIVKLLRPGGRIGILMMHDLPEGRSAADCRAGETWLGSTLDELGISYEAFDHTLQHAAFWRRNYQAAKDLQVEFEAEGNGFIPASLIRESEEEFLPGIEAGTVVRYLYYIRV